MFNGRKVVVTMTSWTKRIGNCVKVIQSILENTVQPDLVFLNLSLAEFPNRNRDLPKDLVELSLKNPRVKINWVPGPNTKSMKKVFPILKYLDDEDVIITCDDDLLLPNQLIAFRLDDFKKNGCNCGVSIHDGCVKYDGHELVPVGPTSLFQKKAFIGFETFLDDLIVNTYNDDRTYAYIAMLNDYKIRPASKLGYTEFSNIKTIGDDYGMTRTKQYPFREEYDNLVVPHLMERFCATSIGQVIENFNKIDMTAISVFYDAGVNPLRKVATKKAVANWMKQKHLPKEMMFIELGFNGTFTFSQDDFPKEIVYSRIDGTDANKYLFQKEHLWNIAAKRAKYEKLMFIDSDIAPMGDVDWFFSVFKLLDRCVFTQGFSQLIYLDANDNKLGNGCLSLTEKYCKNKDALRCVPGGVYCISKQTLKSIGWFNFLPFGGGDDLFWEEILEQSRQSNILFPLVKRYGIGDKMIETNPKKKKLETLSVSVYHFYHGDLKNRSYTQRQFMLMTQYPWIGQICDDDKNGLLCWIDTNHYFRHVMSQFHTVNNQLENVDDLMKCHIRYKEFVQTIVGLDGRKHNKSFIENKLKDAISQCTIKTDGKTR